MHYSRLCAILIDCNTANLNEAARFWAEALGRPWTWTIRAAAATI